MSAAKRRKVSAAFRRSLDFARQNQRNRYQIGGIAARGEQGVERLG
jgi:Mg-chelatase subunit ChlD